MKNKKPPSGGFFVFSANSMHEACGLAMLDPELSNHA